MYIYNINEAENARDSAGVRMLGNNECSSDNLNGK